MRLTLMLMILLAQSIVLKDSGICVPKSTTCTHIRCQHHIDYGSPMLRNKYVTNTLKRMFTRLLSYLLCFLGVRVGDYQKTSLLPLFFKGPMSSWTLIATFTIGSIVGLAMLLECL
jgi:hypothetical protein